MTGAADFIPGHLPRITDAFVCEPDCPRCLGSGHVCEDHPDKPWDEGDGCCSAAGMPCNPDLRGDPSTWPARS